MVIKMRKISKEREEELVRLFGLRAVDRAISLSELEDWKAEQAKKRAAKKKSGRGIVTLKELSEPLALTKEEIVKRKFEKAKKKHLNFVLFVQESRREQWTLDDDSALNILQRRKKQIKKRMKKVWLEIYAEDIARALAMFELDWKKATLEFAEDEWNIYVTLRIGKKRIDQRRLLEEYERVMKILKEASKYEVETQVFVDKKSLRAIVKAKINEDWKELDWENGKVIINCN